MGHADLVEYFDKVSTSIPISNQSWIAKNYDRHRRLHFTHQSIKYNYLEIDDLRNNSLKIIKSKRIYSKKEVDSYLKKMTSIKENLIKSIEFLDDAIKQFSSLHTFKR